MKEDLIRRSDVINLLWYFQDECCSAVVEDVEKLPSANRPQGHYIKGESGEWYCSECKRIDDKYSVARFCWYCGARMKGADDD